MLSWYRFHFKSGGAKSFQKFRHQKLFQCSLCKSLLAEGAGGAGGAGGAAGKNQRTTHRGSGKI